MKLLQSPTSPYARKVRMAILEKGLTAKVALVAASPAGAEADMIRTANPLGKVPCLVLDDGRGLYDSPVICEYLDGLAPSPVLIPRDGAARWEVLRLQALADGIMDAAVSARMESLRPDGQKSADMIAHWHAGIARGVKALAHEARLSSAAWDLGHISTAAALGYLHFRLPDVAKTSMPTSLETWWDKAQSRPSVKETAPPG
jgi:glutathione S-transferase